MEGIEKKYNIHDIVTFKIIDRTNFFDKYLSNLDMIYKNFETEEISNPDFIVYLGNFSPSNHDCYILDDRYYVKEDYFYCKDTRKLAKWEFEMRGFESGDMVAYIHTNLFGNFSVSGNIIEFLIHFKMNEKGFPLVHASCISKDNHAFLFPARSGGGKTTVALYFVEKGFDFLGDNFIILHEDKVLCFLSPLNIFTYNLAPVIKKNFGLRNKIILGSKYLLYRMTAGYIKIFTKVNIKEKLPNQMIDKSELDAIFFLIPREKLRMESINKEELIDHLVTNQELDFFHLPFLKYILAYSYMFPDSNMSTHWEKYKENLRMSISENIPIFKVEVPQKYNTEVLEKIFKLVAKD